jgi:hypothetical protein
MQPTDSSEHSALFKWDTLREVGSRTLDYEQPVQGKVLEVELSSGHKILVFRADDLPALLICRLRLGKSLPPRCPFWRRCHVPSAFPGPTSFKHRIGFKACG